MLSECLSVALYVPGERDERPRLDLSFEVAVGINVLAGPSGSGKSTCLAALAGLLRPAHGRIVLDDNTLLDTARGIEVPTHARRVALVFQSLALFPHLSVAENVAFGVPASAPGAGTRHAEPRTERKARREALVAHWLERMRIGHLARRRPATLSGGEAQRVALARALASSPALLLLDEPFSALDAALRDELSEEVCGVVEELGIPALLVSHQPNHRLSYGARTIELRNGVIVKTTLHEDGYRPRSSGVTVSRDVAR